MGWWRGAIVAVILAMGMSGVWAVDVEQMSTEALRLRYQALSEELRCPKCQNQNLADSGSPIAKDLRREIRRLLEAGDSDQQIIDYLVARYGDFILYRPRWRDNTYGLWLAPGALLGVGLVTVLVVVLRQRRAAPVARPELDETELAALRQMLDPSGSPVSEGSEDSVDEERRS